MDQTDNELLSGPVAHPTVMQKVLGIVVRFAIALHFTAILLVVSHVDELLTRFPATVPIVALLNRYSLVTCANRNFGFFAPSVTPDWNLRIIASNDAGESFDYRLPCPSREMEVKMYSMLGHFSENEDTMDLFARSWAVYTMNANRTATKVEIDVTRNLIPSMREFRDGKRMEKSRFYRTTFDLR